MSRRVLQRTSLLSGRIQKLEGLLEKFFRGVFKEIVAGVWKLECVSFGEASLESSEEFMRCEAPVLHAPNKLDGMILEQGKSLFDA